MHNSSADIEYIAFGSDTPDIHSQEILHHLSRHFLGVVLSAAFLFFHISRSGSIIFLDLCLSYKN